MAIAEAKNGSVSALKHLCRSITAAADLLMPPACRLCGEPVESEKDFCHQCLLTLTLSEPKMATACPRCGRPGALSSSKPDLGSAEMATLASPPETNYVSEGEPIAACAFCHKEKFVFDQVVARWTYEGRVCDAIVAAKHSSQSALGNSLGRFLGQRVMAEVADDSPDWITYVPSSFGRQMLRGGTNGNVAITESVAKCLQQEGHKSRFRTLLRVTRGIKKQAWLTDQERRQNVAGAFAVKNGYASFWTPRLANSLHDQHVLVVDDVLTTGATANEVSRVLYESGVRRVTLAVVARSVWSKS